MTKLIQPLGSVKDKKLTANVQGYVLEDGQFIVKELGVCFPEKALCRSYFFKPPDHVTISVKREQFARHYLHTLSFDDGQIPYVKMKPLLKKLTARRELYVRGQTQCDIFRTLGIEARQVEEGTRLVYVTNTMPPCNLTNHRVNDYCAMKRAFQCMQLLNKPN